jgi:hypothetical protein
MTTQRLVSGKSVLRKFLQSNRDELAQSPALVVSSFVSQHDSPSQYTEKVDSACQKLEFYISMEFGLKTVSSKVSSVFPTLGNIDSALLAAQRTGALTVIGVGSGAAMDLTKAILKESDKEMTGILVPSTYGAIMASAASLPLILDTQEEALILLEGNYDMSETVDADPATIIVETNGIADIHKDDAVYASLAIGVDAIYRSDSDNGSSLLGLASKAIDAKDEKLLSDTLLSAGNTLSYGVAGSSVRSSPLALAASLIPISFPNASMLTFMASLLPGIVQIMGNPEQNLSIDVNDKSIPALATLMVHADGAQSVGTLMSHVKANQALWGCSDVEDSVLEAILHHSLNR